VQQLLSSGITQEARATVLKLPALLEVCAYQPEAVQLLSDTQHVLINRKLQAFHKVKIFEL